MSGNNGTLKSLYLAHKDRLYTIAAAIVGEAGLAEDVLHDVFAQLVSDPARLAGARSPAAYLVVCVRNRALSVVRRRRSRQALLAGRAGRADGETPGPWEDAERRAENARLMETLVALPDELRDVVAMRIWGRLGFREIAKATGASRSTVHNRYRQAIETLRRRMNKE